MSRTCDKHRNYELMALVEGGDRIVIDIPNRLIDLVVPDVELELRCDATEVRGDAAWKPKDRARHVSLALQAYAALTTSRIVGAGSHKQPFNPRPWDWPSADRSLAAMSSGVAPAGRAPRRLIDAEVLGQRRKCRIGEIEDPGNSGTRR